MTAIPAKEIRVLLLEDVPTDAELIQNELRKAKLVFRAERVETREDFIRAIAERTPDIILADYKLPDFDGLTALAIARAQCPEVPFVFVTGTLGEERAVELLKQGAADYIIKGRLSRLGPAVQRALDDVQRHEEQQAADRALQQSEMRYRRLFETALDGIMILSADTAEVVDVNPFLTEMLGYSRDELLHKQPWDIGAFKDMVLNKDAFRRLRKEGYLRYHDLPLQTKDGRLIDVEFICSSYSTGVGNVIQCNIRDISAARQTLKKLREQLDELRRFEKVAIGREQRMQELKEEIAQLRKRLTKLERPDSDKNP